MILKNDNKGWSEADLTWETAFLPDWLPQKPLETLAFICKWSPLWTKEFNRKSNEQNQWVGSNQIGPWRWSGKRWARASLGPFWSNCCEGGGLLLPASRASQVSLCTPLLLLQPLGASGQWAASLRTGASSQFGECKEHGCAFRDLKTIQRRHFLFLFFFWTGWEMPQLKACP